MKTQRRPINLAICLITLAVAAGCASTTQTERQNLATGNLMQPNHIWVYNFAAMPAEVAAGSALAGQASQGAAPLSAQQIGEGQKLGAEIATGLIQQIQAMGLPARNASAASNPQLNDVVIEGSLLSIQQGNGAERVTIGLTAGESALKVEVEVYQMTVNGMRLLGSSDVEATGNKTPGAALTVEGRAKQIVQEIAAALKKQFLKQGWISGNASFNQSRVAATHIGDIPPEQMRRRAEKFMQRAST